MSAPFFSIIVPIYKVEQYIDRCIQSVISQSFGDFELILVDDGSPDNCPKICDEWEKKDDRVIVLHRVNGGSSDARNAGLNIANGKYVLFLDSDDYWCDIHLLRDVHNRSHKYGEDIILIGSKTLYENGTEEVTRSNYNLDILNRHNKVASLDSLISDNNFPGSAWIYAVTRSLIESKNLRFKLGVTAEDYEWIVATVISANAIGAIDGIQYVYVRRSGSITTQSKFSGIQGAKNAFVCYYSMTLRFKAMDSFLSRIYLFAVMSYNRLPSSDRVKARPILGSYMKILKEAGHPAFYWFVRLTGLRFSSIVISFVYKIVR